MTDTQRALELLLAELRGEIAPQLGIFPRSVSMIESLRADLAGRRESIAESHKLLSELGVPDNRDSGDGLAGRIKMLAEKLGGEAGVAISALKLILRGVEHGKIANVLLLHEDRVVPISDVIHAAIARAEGQP